MGILIQITRAEVECLLTHVPVGSLGIAVDIVGDAILFDGAANRTGAARQCRAAGPRGRLGQTRPMLARPTLGCENFIVTIGVEWIIHKCFCTGHDREMMLSGSAIGGTKLLSGLLE
jgi:hypothetical protein